MRRLGEVKCGAEILGRAVGGWGERGKERRHRTGEEASGGKSVSIEPENSRACEQAEVRGNQERERRSRSRKTNQDGLRVVARNDVRGVKIKFKRMSKIMRT